jgi:molybdopterin converting factor subunit 1
MHILFFAQLKDAARCDSVELAVATPLDAEQLWAELLNKFPALAAHRPSVRLAKNLEYAEPQTTFANADEVALIPPVSGG